MKTKYSREFLRKKIRTPIVRYAEGNDGTINFKLRKELVITYFYFLHFLSYLRK